MITHAPDYIANSLELGSYEWNNLIRAIKKAKIYVALGFSEKYEDRIYMGQALISPEGEKLLCALSSTAFQATVPSSYRSFQLD